MPTEYIYDFYISFTYLEHAFKRCNISGIGGRLLLSGHIGTLALYTYTFGIYGAAMFDKNLPDQAIHHLMETE